MRRHQFTPFTRKMQKVLLTSMLVLFLFACTHKVNPDATSQATSQEGAVNTAKFFELEMDSGQYKSLKDAHHPGGGADPNKMVLQFYYSRVNPVSFTLLAFASKPKNQFETNPATTVSAVLSITANNPVLIPDEIILGDQQVSFFDLDALIAGQTNFVLTFRPILMGNRVVYKICVKGAPCPAAGVVTQPSPPANAK